MSLDSLASKIAKLPANEQRRAIELLRKKRAIECEESYFEFFKSAWRVIEPATKLTESPHIKLICDVIEKQVVRQSKGLPVEFDTIIINVPPSCSKSSIVTKIFPAWIWLKNPAAKVINTSYSSTLALDHSVKTRDIIKSDWYKRNWGSVYKLKEDQNAKSFYNNDKGGTRFATSTGGTLTGFHAHVLISDDPINPEQSESANARETAKRFWERTVPSRLLDNAFKILVMQRLHTDDPTGVELNNEDSRVLHLCLPAELSDDVKPDFARSIYRDGLLDAHRLPKRRLKHFKTSLGSYAYAGQYEQKPIPKGGGIIKTEWFEYIQDWQIPPGLVTDFWIDGAFTKSTANDPTGIMACSYDGKTKTLYVRYFKGEYLEMPELLRKIKEQSVMFSLDAKSKIYIEPKASGKSLKQMINSTYPNLNAVEIKSKIVNEGKTQRAHIASPKFEAGKIKIVSGNWNDEFETQLTGFPSMPHDEAVDLMGYAVDKYFHKPQWTGESF